MIYCNCNMYSCIPSKCSDSQLMVKDPQTGLHVCTDTTVVPAVVRIFITCVASVTMVFTVCMMTLCVGCT